MCLSVLAPCTYTQIAVGVLKKRFYQQQFVRCNDSYFCGIFVFYNVTKIWKENNRHCILRVLLFA